jgi:hypothetical protein
LVDIDEAQLRQLASLDLGRERVTTCYLDLDEDRFPDEQDVESELRRVLQDGRARAKGDPSVLEDLRRIEAHVRAGVDRAAGRGLVMVCSSTVSLWEAIAVPVRLRSQLTIGHVPALGQLEAMVHEADVIGVVLVGPARARLVVFQLGSAVAQRELEWDRWQPSDEDEVVAHAEAVARMVLELHRDERALDAVVLAGADEMASRVEQALHPYLAERRAGRLMVDVDVPLDDLRAEVARLETRIEVEREVALVTELRSSLAGRDGAVAGLPATLHALSAGRLGHLLVSAGYQAKGWRTIDGAVLAAVGPRCDLCAEMMVRADDVVEDAIELALRNGTRVTVLAECDDLDVLGHIGGLVRF